jgi:hypothetical protein
MQSTSSQLIGVEYHCAPCAQRPGASTHTFKSADAQDRERYRDAEARAAAAPSAYRPDALIPGGGETERLLRWGYNHWSDLFNARQLHGLGVLARRINQEPDGPVRRALQTCFSDGLRYQNMLCRYDRQALKPTDVFAVHGFPVPRVSCEPHLLGVRGVGSGGFRHMLAKYERAKRWCEHPYETVHDGERLRRIPTPPERLAPQLIDRAAQLSDSGRALLVRGSLGAGELPADSVDLVLTDPPYYANVQYAELMEFCYAWLRRLAPETPYFDVAHAKTEQDAVGELGHIGILEFAARLSEVYVAAAAALKPGGAFAFTYHHNELEAYAPLVVACLDAGLTPTALFACASEMRASTHIHGRNAATADAVFVLRKAPVTVTVTDFTAIDVDAFVAQRHAALSGAGLQPTAADAACLRFAVHAARAMTRLAPDWDAGAPPAERTAAALLALGLIDAPVATPA